MKILQGFRAKVVSTLPFMYYFVGPVAFLSYFFSISRVQPRIKRGFAALTVPLLVLVGYHLLVSGFTAVLQIRFFWGWVLFFLFYSSHRLDETAVLFLRKTFIVLCLYTLCEAAAVNSFIDAATLPNYPHDREAASSHLASLYQRPYSFGGNPTVTSTILIAMGLVLQLELRYKALLAVTVLVIGSVGGILLYVVSHIAGAFSGKNVVILVLALTSYFAFVPDEYLGKDKLTEEYALGVAESKLEGVLGFGSSRDILGVLIGKISSQESYGGDFALYSFAENFGLIGLVVLGLFMFHASRGSTFLPLFILFAGSLHYGVMFSLPGQMLFGLLLAEGLDLKEPGQVQVQVHEQGLVAPAHAVVS